MSEAKGGCKNRTQGKALVFLFLSSRLSSLLALICMRPSASDELSMQLFAQACSAGASAGSDSRVPYRFCAWMSSGLGTSGWPETLWMTCWGAASSESLAWTEAAKPWTAIWPSVRGPSLGKEPRSSPNMEIHRMRLRIISLGLCSCCFDAIIAIFHYVRQYVPGSEYYTPPAPDPGPHVKCTLSRHEARQWTCLVPLQAHTRPLSRLIVGVSFNF